MKHIKFAVALAMGASPILAEAVPDTGLYEEAKSTVAEWAAAENLISKEKNDWKREKAILEDLARMLETEAESLNEKIEQARESETEADKRRSEVVERQEALQAASAVARQNLESLEGQIRALLPYLPQSYLESIKTLTNQLPQPGRPTQLPLSIRLRNVIGILSQANKFDNVISLETETRSFSGGQSKQVNTVYFGFAIAYYADASGENAGYGYPTAEGWQWEEASQYGSSILSMISMYQKGRQAAFVKLPVVIK